MDWTSTMRASAAQMPHQRRARPDARETTNSRMSAISSALLSALNTTRPTSRPISRVIVGAENRTGVASSEIPAVIPNQLKQTQAGFESAERSRRLSVIAIVFAVPRALFSAVLGRKLRVLTDKREL